MSFNNQILKNILLNLNLNERAKLRLINKQFKEVIDSIQFQEDDLIIFDRKPPIKERYKFKDKFWRLEQTVYVTNLNLFFQQFKSELINLKSLVIYSVNNDIFNCDIDFKQLNYLELHHIQFKSSKILQSTKLENLYLRSDCLFEDNILLKVNKLNNLCISSNLFYKLNSSNNQKSSIKYNYLELNTKFTINSNLYSIVSNVNAKHTRLYTNLDTAISIINSNKNIKIMDLNLINELNNQSYLDSSSKLFTFFRSKNNLDFRLFGIKIGFSNMDNFPFIMQLIPYLIMQDGEIFGFTISHHDNPLIKSNFNDNSIDLKLFLQRLNWIEFKNHLHINEDIFEQMINVKTISLLLNIESDINYDDFFNCFPQLEHIKIIPDMKSGLRNNLFNRLSSNCLNIQYLKFHYFESLDLNFLFTMKNLKCLIFLIYYPIDNNLFIDLIEQLKYISFVAIQFPIKEYDGLKNELSDFKQKFLLAIRSKIKSNKFNFTIQLINKKLKDNQMCTMVKYKYERNNYSKTEFKNLDNDLNNNDVKEILKVIDHKGIEFNQFSRPRNYQNNLLIDDVLVYVLKNFFDLNERTKLRLVSKQFKFVIDQIIIEKLSVYHLRQRDEFISELTGEKFSLSDSVYVYDLNKFFESKSILNSIKDIEKLILFGLNKYSINVKTTFNKLNHLEIYDQLVTTSDILKSPNISNLLISNCYFYDKLKLHKMKKEDRCFNSTGLNNLNGKIKKLSLSIEIPQMNNLCTEIDFFRECKIRNLFTELEQLECNLLNLSTIEFINDNFNNLKILNVNFGKNSGELANAVGNNDLDNIVGKLRDNLILNLFGCELTKQTVSIVKEFFIFFKDCFRYDIRRKIRIILNSDIKWYGFKSIFRENEHLFDGFFELVNSLVFNEYPIDITILCKLNIDLIDSTLYLLKSNLDLHSYFKLFPKIYELRLTGLTRRCDINRILIKLPDYFKNLVRLGIDNDKINFEFLVNLPSTISSIDLNSKYPIEQELFLNLIRKYSKHNLAFLQDYFELKKNFDRDQLANFKADVLNCINNDLKLIDTSFKIEIIRRNNLIIGRYVFRRNNFFVDNDNPFKAKEEDILVSIDNISGS